MEEEKTEKFGSKVEGFERFRTIVINRRINDSKINFKNPLSTDSKSSSKHSTSLAVI